MQNGNQNKKRPNTVEADQLKYQLLYSDLPAANKKLFLY